MKLINIMETFDGRRFETASLAARYLDQLYGNLMTAIASDLIHTDCKYKNLIEWLDEEDNRSKVARLSIIKADMKIADET